MAGAQAGQPGGAADAPRPEDLSGISILPLLLGTGTLPERDLFWHFPAYLQGPGRHRADSPDGVWRATPCSVIMHGDRKLIHYLEDDRIEFFDLGSDVGERQNLAADRQQEAAALRARLEAWCLAEDAPLPRTANPDFDPAAFAAAAHR